MVGQYRTSHSTRVGQYLASSARTALPGLARGLERRRRCQYRTLHSEGRGEEESATRECFEHMTHKAELSSSLRERASLPGSSICSVSTEHSIANTFADLRTRRRIPAKAHTCRPAAGRSPKRAVSTRAGSA
eukprot:1603594-Rhodomonas_salina.2